MDMADSARPKFDLIDVRSARRMLHVELPRLSEPAGFTYVDVLFPPDDQELLARPVSSSYPDAPAAPVYRVDRQSGELDRASARGPIRDVLLRVRDGRSPQPLPHELR